MTASRHVDELRAALFDCWNRLPSLSGQGPVFFVLPDGDENVPRPLDPSLRMLAIEQSARLANQYWSCAKSTESGFGVVNDDLMALFARLEIALRLPFFYVGFRRSGDDGMSDGSLLEIARTLDRCRAAVRSSANDTVDHHAVVGRRIGEAVGDALFDFGLDTAVNRHLLSEKTHTQFERATSITEAMETCGEVLEKLAGEDGNEPVLKRQAEALARACLSFIREVPKECRQPARINAADPPELLGYDKAIPLVVAIDEPGQDSGASDAFVRAIVADCANRRAPVLVVASAANRTDAIDYFMGGIHSTADTQRDIEQRVICPLLSPRSAPDTTSLLARGETFLQTFSQLIGSGDEAIKRAGADALLVRATDILDELADVATTNADPRNAYLAFLAQCAVTTLIEYAPISENEKITLLENASPISEFLGTLAASDPNHPLVEMGGACEAGRLQELSSAYSALYDMEDLRRLCGSDGDLDRLVDIQRSRGDDMSLLWIVAETYLHKIAMLRPDLSRSGEQRLASLGAIVAAGAPLVGEAHRLKRAYREGVAAYYRGLFEEAEAAFRLADEGYENAPTEGMPEGDEPNGARHKLVKSWLARSEGRLTRNHVELAGHGPVGETWQLVKKLWGSR